VLTGGLLAQQWLLQAVELVDGKVAAVHTIPLEQVGGDNVASWQTPNITSESELLLVVSAITDGTTEPAVYRIRIE
jgi:hypothetical protein